MNTVWMIVAGLWIVLSAVVVIFTLGAASEEKVWLSASFFQKVYSCIVVFLFWPLFIIYGIGKGVAQIAKESKERERRLQEMRSSSFGKKTGS